MTGPAISQQENSDLDDLSQDTQEQVTQETPPETQEPSPTNNTPVTPTQPQAPQLDYQSLYSDSIRQRIAYEAEIQRLRAEQNQRQNAPDEPEITNDDIQQNPAQSIQELIRRELRGVAAGVNEFQTERRVTKELEHAENTVFSAMPHLAPFRGYLGGEVRKALQNAKTVDPATFAVTLDAVIGRHYNQMLANPAAFQVQNTPASPANPAANTQMPNNPPPRTPAPAPRNQAPQNTAPIKLSEMERKSMRQHNYDPNKREDVDRFLAIVNNDEGVTYDGKY